MSDKIDALELTTQIVSSYVSGNAIAAEELPDLIRTVYSSISLPAAPVEPPAAAPSLTPAQIRKSITPELLISFEDGKGYKTLKRHLGGLGLTPETYRAKWGLPRDYPMISPAYAVKRSELAKTNGLGQKRKR